MKLLQRLLPKNYHLILVSTSSTPASFIFHSHRRFKFIFLMMVRRLVTPWSRKPLTTFPPVPRITSMSKTFSTLTSVAICVGLNIKLGSNRTFFHGKLKEFDYYRYNFLHGLNIPSINFTYINAGTRIFPNRVNVIYRHCHYTAIRQVYSAGFHGAKNPS
jgi:hypothetical protein